MRYLAGSRRQPQRALLQLGWTAVDSELQLARQRLQLQRPSAPRPRLFSYSSLLGGSFFYKLFLQPPSILPTSTNGAERPANFLLSIALSSQAIRRNNLSVSSLMLAFSTMGSLCSLAAKPAVWINSISAIKSSLIFSPKEYRVNLGICGRALCQSL